MAVRPDRLLAGRSAGGIEAALLRDEHERPCRVASGVDVGLGAGDLLERAAEVDGSCVGELRVAPRDRAVDRDVELEDARPVAVPAKLIGVAAGQPSPAMASELAPG